MPQCSIHQQTTEQQAKRQDGGTGIAVVEELCQEIAHQYSQATGFLEVGRDIVPTEQEQLVLLLKEEVIGISELEETVPARNP